MITNIVKRYQLAFLLLLLLVVTLPFIGQAVHVDAHQFIDWAKLELNHPLWQHLPNYDYFGVHYHQTDYHDTHPRLQSLYLSLWLRITGSLAEPLLHLEMLVFPIMAVTAMYFLARRFRVNALIATLLLIVSPAFLVNTHLIMTDVPGIAFWLAAMAAFLKGADDDSVPFLALAAVFLSLGIFTYYQDLSLLPLLFLYLLIFRKVKARTMIALAVPVILFIAFFAAHYAYYHSPPNFSYTFGLPLDLHSILMRLRGTTALLGGAIVFPVAAFAVFSRYRFATRISLGVLIVAAGWSLLLYNSGNFVAEDVLILPWLLAAGVLLLLFVVGKMGDAIPDALIGAGGRDEIILGVWFLGILFYNYVLLPYASPRYMIPLVPPLAILAAKEFQRIWGNDPRRLAKIVAVVAGLTLVLALSVAVGEHFRANNNVAEAEWVSQHYPNNGHVWFDGGLGFQYYLQQKGYRMALLDGEGMETGDYIVESIGNNRWEFDKDVVYRLQLVDQVQFPRKWPLITEYADNKTSWMGQIGSLIPYGFEGDYVDKIYVYRVALTPEEEKSCRVQP